MKPILFLILGCVTCSAGTIYDPFNQSQAGGCNYSFASPYSTCDVIGNPALFDIQQATVNVENGWATVTIDFNYGGGITLQPFTDGIPLAVGDLFFYAPSDPGNYLYGVPLSSHGGFTADSLYLVGGNTTLLTADDIIDNTGYYYRRNQDVLAGWQRHAGNRRSSRSSGQLRQRSEQRALLGHARIPRVRRFCGVRDSKRPDRDLICVGVLRQ